MSRTKLTGEELASAVRRLKGRFPKLERLARRKKNFSQGERQSIYYAIRAAEIMTLPAKERRALADDGEIPAYFARYKFPRDRRLSDKRMKEMARDYLRFATPETKETLRKIIKHKGPLTPAMRGVITKKRKAIPFTEDIVPLPKSVADQLPAFAVRGKGKDADRQGAGIYGIKLKNHDPAKIRKLRVKNKILMFEEKESGKGAKTRRWLYVPIDFKMARLDDGEDFLTTFMRVAKTYFDQGAAQVQIWTINGRAGDAYASGRLLERDLSTEYLRYMRINEDEDAPFADTTENWILGLAVLFRV